MRQDPISFIDNIFTYISLAIEVVGIAIIVMGLLWAFYTGFRDRHKPDQYTAFRSHIGRGLLLGLEILVAADIVRTVALQLTMDRVATLGLLILIRTFLSWALEVEITGNWPWHHSKSSNKASIDPET
jgi:uncharacterized membrane protein